jgi:hypothetical protein
MRLTTEMPTTIAPPIALTMRPRSILWWKPIALRHVVQTWLTALAQRQAFVHRDIRPDFPRQETPVDRLARTHTFLYACSLMG